MEIKDILGLKRIERLLKVCSKGIGACAKPILKRLNASADANEVKKISGAIADAESLPVEIKYKGENLQIESLPKGPSHRAVERFIFQEKKKQSNTEKIIGYSANALLSESEENVSDDPIDEDWITRFFRVSEDISNDHMQELWGRVLAGEVKRPNSFALRTLDILRNFTKEEAESFARIAKLRIQFGYRNSFLLYVQDYSPFEVPYDDVLLVKELKLLAEDKNVILTFSIKPEQICTFIIGKTGLLCKAEKEVSVRFPIIDFTVPGQQLTQLIPQDEAPPEDYLKLLAKHLKSDGVTFRISDHEVLPDGMLSFTNQRPLQID